MQRIRRLTNSALPNCSLLVEQINPASVPATPPYGGSCYTDDNPISGYQDAALSCAAMNGMGGAADDRDYNDAYYTVSCTISGGRSTGNTQVVLTK